MSAAELIAAGALAEPTAGGHLELVSEFEVRPGGHVNPHRHPTHEFYLVRSGRGLMTIGERSWEIGPGELVTIPSQLVHSLEPVGAEPIRCFCFAVGDPGAPPVDYGSDGDGPAPVDVAGTASLPALEIRSPRALEPALEHRGTVAVWWTVPPRELRAATLGGRLGAVTGHALAAGETLAVPAAPALRIYAVGAGEGTIAVDGETRALRADDVVLVGPGREHVLAGPAGGAPTGVAPAGAAPTGGPAASGELSFLSVAYELKEAAA
jgi:mannose-6-phosphate isomerase-like protein (cupin superfamily)